MDKRDCGGCGLWRPAGPGAFEGACCYFPPQLVVVDGQPVNLRPLTTRDEGCHIGWRPRACLPAALRVVGGPS